MVVYDTSLNGRDKWIDEIKEYVDLVDSVDVIQFALSFTLQACRNGDLDRYKWCCGCWL